MKSAGRKRETHKLERATAKPPVVGYACSALSCTKSNAAFGTQVSAVVLGKPGGVIQPRVEAVGPRHFGIAAVDCGKARSKWMLCDF
jgi:hypothetical protein